MIARPPLPPGQREREDFPRFGLTQFANRFPARADRIELRIRGDVRTPLTLADELARLPRVEQRSDFHCVTTWSRRAVAWGGYRFTDFYHQLVLPLAGPADDITLVVLRGQDGARGSLPLADLLVHFSYTASVFLQRKYQERLSGIFGTQTQLPDLYSSKLGVSLDVNPDTSLANLSKRHQALSGQFINWLGTYEHAAERLIKHMEKFK